MGQCCFGRGGENNQERENVVVSRNVLPAGASEGGGGEKDTEASKGGVVAPEIVPGNDRMRRDDNQKNVNENVHQGEYTHRRLTTMDSSNFIEICETRIDLNPEAATPRKRSLRKNTDSLSPRASRILNSPSAQEEVNTLESAYELREVIKEKGFDLM